MSKVYCVDCGIKISDNRHKRCIDCFGKSVSGRKHPNWHGGKPNCVNCGKKISDNRHVRCIDCRGKYYSGKNHPMFGRIAFPPPKIKYNKIYFRSLWEANFAKFLDLSEIAWHYESKAFDLGTATYTPDFYLVDFDCYVEIKGRWQGLAKKKFNFVKNHFNIRLKLFDERKLKQIGVL